MQLDPERVDQLVAMLRAGSYLDVACRAVGLDVEEFDEHLRGDDELRERVEQARAQAEVANLALVSRAARDGVWLAAAWILERVYPERYARPAQRQDEKTAPVVLGSDRLDDLADRRAARRARARS